MQARSLPFTSPFIRIAHLIIACADIVLISHSGLDGITITLRTSQVLSAQYADTDKRNEAFGQIFDQLNTYRIFTKF